MADDYIATGLQPDDIDPKGTDVYGMLPLFAEIPDDDHDDGVPKPKQLLRPIIPTRPCPMRSTAKMRNTGGGKSPRPERHPHAVGRAEDREPFARQFQHAERRRPVASRHREQGQDLFLEY